MEWHYLNNQFVNATTGSFRLMLTVTNDHYAKLQAQQADPDIAQLLARTGPVHNNFLKRYSAWKGAQGAYKGATQKVDAMLFELQSTFARQWDTAIMVQYDKGTSEHTTLLPSGREPFQQGTMDERIQAVKTLAEALAPFASLSALETTVDTFHQALKQARDGQQGKEQLSAQSSTDLEAARIEVGIMMYRNLGVLIDKFGSDPLQILNYYELQLLQRGSTQQSSEEFEGVVGPLQTVNITSGIDPQSTVIITNTGSVVLRFCAAPDATTGCSSTISVAPGAVVEVPGSDLSGASTPFVNVTNTDPTLSGSYNVEVVAA